MSRWQAFAIHLAISTGLLLVMLLLVFSIWYPGILFSVDGGWSGLRIVIGVDLVVGPLMTLIVFKAGKPGLKFDLTAIAVFQLSCMTAGMWIVYNDRPLALVLAYDTIYSISAQELEAYEKDPALLDSFPGPYPKVLYAELPEAEIAAEVAAMRSQFIGDPLYIQTERYRAIPREDPAQVFRWEGRVRATLDRALLERLPEGCLLAKFVSVVASGFVCFNPGEMRLEEFYEFSNRRMAGDEGVDVVLR